MTSAHPRSQHVFQIAPGNAIQLQTGTIIGPGGEGYTGRRDPEQGGCRDGSVQRTASNRVLSRLSPPGRYAGLSSPNTTRGP